MIDMVEKKHLITEDTIINIQIKDKILINTKQIQLVQQEAKKQK